MIIMDKEKEYFHMIAEKLSQKYDSIKIGKYDPATELPIDDEFS